MPNQTPRTIEELRAWYIAHNLPPENVTRFFIGKNTEEAKAFGIYRDGDCITVYKNKTDGSRAVRYQGPDEGYAVNQLYMRLKDEIAQQKTGSAFRKETERRTNKIAQFISFIVIAVIIAAVCWFVVWYVKNTPDTGYYNYNDSWYYYRDGWYEYAEYGWISSSYPDELNDNYDNYYVQYLPDDSDGIPPIELTEYYSNTDSDSSWDSSDSWDSDSTDWDSDW